MVQRNQRLGVVAARPIVAPSHRPMEVPSPSPNASEQQHHLLLPPAHQKALLPPRILPPTPLPPVQILAPVFPQARKPASVSEPLLVLSRLSVSYFSTCAPENGRTRQRVKAHTITRSLFKLL